MNYYEAKNKCDSILSNPIDLKLSWLDIQGIVEGLTEGLESELNQNLLGHHEPRLVQLGKLLSKLISLDLASFCYQKCYDKLLEIELIKNERIHKGNVLYWIADNYRRKNEIDLAFDKFLDCFLEDIMTENSGSQIPDVVKSFSNSIDSPSVSNLVLFFNVNINDLILLKDNCISLLTGNKCFNALQLRNLLIVNKKPIIKYWHYSNYYPNISVLKEEFKQINDSTGKHFERFASLFFSTVRGWEIVHDVSVGQKDYQFDALIRNRSNEITILNKFGDYIAVECKNYSKHKISVEQFNHFAMKLIFHNIKTGILFSKNGITGDSIKEYLKYSRAVRSKLSSIFNIQILVFNEQDITDILNGRNLIMKIDELYESSKFDL
jgi:hypothetical protein